MYFAKPYFMRKNIGQAGRSDGITITSGVLARMIDEICVEATGHTCRNPPGMFLIDRGCSNLKFHPAENRPFLSLFLSFFLCIRFFLSLLRGARTCRTHAQRSASSNFRIFATRRVGGSFRHDTRAAKGHSSRPSIVHLG